MTLKNQIQLPVLVCFFLLMLFFHPAAFAQLPRISSVKVNPVNPVKNDAIQIITTAMHSSGDVWGTSQFAVDTIQKKIRIDLVQCSGLLTVIGTKVDTFNLGQLPVGMYEIVTRLFVSNYDVNTGACSNVYVDRDADTSLFSITPSTGISGTSNKQELLVFPNPFQSKITVALKAYPEDAILHMYSLTGQEMMTCKMNANNLTMDMNELENGIYFLILRSEQGIYYSRKVIKNSNGQ